jgi:hypothetical protein
MKDVHVRLYGLETPELWEEAGSEYQNHLEELCAIDAAGRLMIVWERERLGTNYEGFPRSTFERGIGHVFFRWADNRYLYINGLMHLFKYSSLRRAGKSLLRGRRHIEALRLELPQRGPCRMQLEVPEVSSSTFREICKLRPPLCLLSYPSLPSLDPRDESFDLRISETLDQGSLFGCPVERLLIRYSKDLMPHVTNLRVSPFDLRLSN